jgi:adenosylhomocysteine nucleosidase
MTPADHATISNPCVGLLMATHLEAMPLLERQAFTQLCAAPFAAYACDGIVLVISGIGKAHAAAATAWMIHAFAPTCVINAGAAGSTTGTDTLGAIYQIDTVYEYDRPLLQGDGVASFRITPQGTLQTAALATQDHPVTSDAERERIAQHAALVDMEGAAVVQTCQAFGMPHQLIKYISDTHEAHDIRANINALRDAFCNNLWEYLRLLPQAH